ncbi:MAG TPA: glutathione S-transferase family protein [Pseudomonadales bacterium]|nr:glutathione S-transferase family protein [Pseudomonadales bacterium]
MQLVIGNKNYSSWSLRPWLLLQHFGVPFEEIHESLNAEGLSQRLNSYSPSNRVPVLIEGHTAVWDSLAIGEYVIEQHLMGTGWPKDPHRRAYARSISAEMHAGFSALRNAMPMNIRAKRRVDISPEVQRDLYRIAQIFGDARRAHQASGAWLAGEFSFADCMYAPVASRLKTYGVSLGHAADEYVYMIHELPAMQRWIAGAMQETEVVPEDEAGEPI